MGRPKKQEVLLCRLDALLRVLGHTTACEALSNFVYKWCYGDSGAYEELSSSAKVAFMELGSFYYSFSTPAQVALLVAQDYLAGKPIHPELLYQSANLFRHTVLSKATMRNYFGMPFVLKSIVSSAMTLDVHPDFYEWGLSYVSAPYSDSGISSTDEGFLSESKHGECYIVRAVDKYNQSSKFLFRDPLKKVLFSESVRNLKAWLDLFVEDFRII